MINDTFKYRSTDVAMYIIAYANEHGFVINMTKLQKLLYIAYGTYLALTNERLTDENPQAWPYGPVFPTTRRQLLNVAFETITFQNTNSVKLRDESELKGLIKLVFDTFGNYNAATLSAWSHQDGSPWSCTTHTDCFKWGDRISDDSIKDYFNRIIVRRKDETKAN